MKQRIIRPAVALSILSLSFVLSACPERDGPMEKAGEEIDEAADKLGDAVDD